MQTFSVARERDIPRRALESTIEAVIEVESSRARWQKLAIGWAAFATVLLTAVVFFLLMRSPPAPKILGFERLTSDGRQKLVSIELGSPVLSDGSRLYFTEWQNGTTA